MNYFIVFGVGFLIVAVVITAIVVGNKYYNKKAVGQSLRQNISSRPAIPQSFTLPASYVSGSYFVYNNTIPTNTNGSNPILLELGDLTQGSANTDAQITNWMVNYFGQYNLPIALSVDFSQGYAWPLNCTNAPLLANPNPEDNPNTVYVWAGDNTSCFTSLWGYYLNYAVPGYQSVQEACLQNNGPLCQYAFSYEDNFSAGNENPCMYALRNLFNESNAGSIAMNDLNQYINGSSAPGWLKTACNSSGNVILQSLNQNYAPFVNYSFQPPVSTATLIF